MSEENIQEQPQVTEENVGNVDPQAYQQVSDDMHKYKRQYKETADRVKELEEKLKAIDVAKLEESEEHQKLAEHYRTEAETFKEKYNQTVQSVITDKKISAVQRELNKHQVKDGYVDLITQMIGDDVIVEATSTGRHNVLGADKFVESIKETYPDMFIDPKAPNINNATGDYRQAAQLTGKQLAELKRKDYGAYLEAMKKRMKQS
jgi:hypothetical protein